MFDCPIIPVIPMPCCCCIMFDCPIIPICPVAVGCCAMPMPIACIPIPKLLGAIGALVGVGPPSKSLRSDCVAAAAGAILPMNSNPEIPVTEVGGCAGGICSRSRKNTVSRWAVRV